MLWILRQECQNTNYEGLQKMLDNPTIVECSSYDLRETKPTVKFAYLKQTIKVTCIHTNTNAVVYYACLPACIHACTPARFSLGFKLLRRKAHERLEQLTICFPTFCCNQESKERLYLSATRLEFALSRIRCWDPLDVQTKRGEEELRTRTPRSSSHRMIWCDSQAFWNILKKERNMLSKTNIGKCKSRSLITWTLASPAKQETCPSIHRASQRIGSSAIEISRSN